jgi:hypothetical protein
MWFAAATLGKGGLHTLHESTSSDGVHWSEPSPVLLENAYCPSVLKSGQGYEMWFSDVSRRPWVIRHAASSDGRRWSVTQRPALVLNQDWEAEVLVYPTVLKSDGAYLMWYGSYDRAVRRETTAIGFAVSRDGRQWHKSPHNPVLRPDPRRPWESNYVGSGCVSRLADGSFRYWYASRKAPPFLNLYFAINTARWAGLEADGAAAIEPPPQHVQRYLKRCAEAHAQAIEAEAAWVKFLADTPNRGGEIEHRFQAASEKLKQLREQPAPLVALPLPPTKDDMGVLTPAGARVGRVDCLEVVDEDEAIVRVWHAPDAALALTPAEDETFVDLWVQGIDSSLLTAGTATRLSQVFHVTGNKLFDTTCGRRSMPLLVPFDIEPYRKDRK